MPTDSLKQIAAQVEKIKAIRDNDEGVLKLFYQANYPKAEGYVLNNNGTVEEAKDIYQEAVIAIWQNIKLGRFTPKNDTSLDGYLYQVVKNKWLDHLRHTKRRQVIPLLDENNSVEDTLTFSEDKEQQLITIKTNLKLLGKMCRDVLDRFYYQKQPMIKIATAMNWTEATAKNNKYRCLQQLRELIKQNVL